MWAAAIGPGLSAGATTLRWIAESPTPGFVVKGSLPVPGGAVLVTDGQGRVRRRAASLRWCRWTWRFRQCCQFSGRSLGRERGWMGLAIERFAEGAVHRRPPRREFANMASLPEQRLAPAVARPSTYP